MRGKKKKNELAAFGGRKVKYIFIHLFFFYFYRVMQALKVRSLAFILRKHCFNLKYIK